MEKESMIFWHYLFLRTGLFSHPIVHTSAFCLTHFTRSRLQSYTLNMKYFFILFIITFMIRKNSFGRTDNLTRHSYFPFVFILFHSKLFPFGCSWWFWSQIVQYSSYTRDLKNILRIEIASFDGSKMENTKMVEFMKRLQSQRFPSSIYRSST